MCGGRRALGGRNYGCHHTVHCSVLESYWSYQPPESSRKLRSNRRKVISHDDFRLNRHWGCDALIFPQASAMVSKARSNRNSGLR